MKPCLSLLLILLTAACHQPSKATQQEPADSIATPAEAPQLKAEVTMAFVGDVMMGTNFPDNSYVTKDRGRSLFIDCAEHLQGADVAVANLEGTCYDGTEGELRRMTNPRTYFIFRMPGDHADRLAEAGVDIVNCANNHSFDFGQTGRNLTLANLRRAGIEPTGVRDLAESCIVERQGVRFGYVSFAASCTKVLDMLDYEEVERQIEKLRPDCDILMVGFHGGAEGTSALHVPMRTEYYVGENRGNVCEFAHFCIDHGADIVVGHGPHVPRALELYKGHLIAYSLGNFCAPYRLGFAAETGHAPLLLTTLSTADGSFLNGRIHSYRQVRGQGPRTDASHQAARDIQRLTAADFPQTPLEISSTGEIDVKKGESAYENKSARW